MTYSQTTPTPTTPTTLDPKLYSTTGTLETLCLNIKTFSERTSSPTSTFSKLTTLSSQFLLLSATATPTTNTTTTHIISAYKALQTTLLTISILTSQSRKFLLAAKRMPPQPSSDTDSINQAYYDGALATMRDRAFYLMQTWQCVDVHLDELWALVQLHVEEGLDSDNLDKFIEYAFGFLGCDCLSGASN